MSMIMDKAGEWATAIAEAMPEVWNWLNNPIEIGDWKITPLMMISTALVGILTFIIIKKLVK